LGNLLVLGHFIWSCFIFRLARCGPCSKPTPKLLATDDSNAYWAMYGDVLQKRACRFNVPNTAGPEPLNGDLSSAMGTKYSVQQFDA
jgi:hypothetical protein